MIDTPQCLRRVCLVLAISLYLVSVALAQSARDIAEYASPSVVLIVAENPKGKPLSLGTGFFVREDVIATNYHVIRGASRLYAKISGQSTMFRIEMIIATDAGKDLALIKLRGIQGSPLHIADGHIGFGDEIYVLGNPEGLEGTFSQGNISGIRQLRGIRYLQISAPVSRGSSGGPVLNKSGEVVGIVVAQLTTGQNLNFAIPVSYLSSLVAETLGGAKGDPLSGLPQPVKESAQPPSIYEEKELNESLLETRKHPSSAEAYYKLAKAYGRSAHFVEAVQAYHRAIRLTPNYAEAYYGLAEVNSSSILWSKYWKTLTEAERAKRLQAAEESYKRAISINPDYVEAHIGLAQTYSLQGRDSEAIESLQLAISINPHSTEAHRELALEYEEMGNHANAVAGYKHVIEIDPNDARAHLSIAKLYLEADAYDEAIKNYKDVIRIYDSGMGGQAYLGLCNSFRASARLSEGVELFKNLVASVPVDSLKDKPWLFEKFAWANYALGLVYLYSGDRRSALEQYKILKGQRDGLAISNANDLFNTIYK
jgi:cytochrome c-type biogenesis protein CcmH/NrfG